MQVTLPIIYDGEIWNPAATTWTKRNFIRNETFELKDVDGDFETAARGIHIGWRAKASSDVLLHEGSLWVRESHGAIPLEAEAGNLHRTIFDGHVWDRLVNGCTHITANAYGQATKRWKGRDHSEPKAWAGRARRDFGLDRERERIRLALEDLRLSDGFVFRRVETVSHVVDAQGSSRLTFGHTLPLRGFGVFPINRGDEFLAFMADNFPDARLPRMPEVLLPEHFDWDVTGQALDSAITVALTESKNTDGMSSRFVSAAASLQSECEGRTAGYGLSDGLLDALEEFAAAADLDPSNERYGRSRAWTAKKIRCALWMWRYRPIDVGFDAAADDRNPPSGGFLSGKPPVQIGLTWDETSPSCETDTRMETMIDAETLSTAGYREFIEAGLRSKGDGCHALWQKKIEDEEGVRYFVNVYEWRLGRVIPAFHGKSASFQPEVQFKHPAADGDEQMFNVTLLGRDGLTVEEMEEFFDRQWRTNGCSHYEKFAIVPHLPDVPGKIRGKVPTMRNPR